MCNTKIINVLRSASKHDCTEKQNAFTHFQRKRNKKTPNKRRRPKRTWWEKHNWILSEPDSFWSSYRNLLFSGGSLGAKNHLPLFSISLRGWNLDGWSCAIINDVGSDPWRLFFALHLLCSHSQFSLLTSESEFRQEIASPLIFSLVLVSSLLSFWS